VTDRLIKRLVKLMKRIRAKVRNRASVSDAIHLWIKESYLSDSYMQKAFENSRLSASEKQGRGDEDTFYHFFESLFRGSTEEIKRRQSVYLPYVAEAHANSKGLFFLDAGCGRGEFLELLKGHGIPAKGVDTNRINIDLARQMCVDVALSGVLEYLNTLKDCSLIGLSMFQVIEHFDFKTINDILKVAFKKISPHGVILLESVNPYCPMALGKFYLDPTHARPYAPDLMKFVLEWQNFEKVKLIYSSPIPKEFKEAVMNYQDYAVLGKKIEL
jgi:SAM-dependent methyltransferase